MSVRIPSVQVELRPSRIHDGGVGVFAVKDVVRSQKVADGIAEEDFQNLVSWEEFPRFDEDLQRKVMAFCIGTPEGFVPPPDFDFNKLSIDWYLNHSCKGNCGFDDSGDFIAIRNIRKDEELSYDYALVESNSNFSMQCSCGCETCRHLVTGNDWKYEKFFLKNRDYMHPRLRRFLPIPA
jgi:hypothetical protein